MQHSYMTSIGLKNIYFLHLAIEIVGPVEIKKDQILEKFSDKWSCWGLFFKVEVEITVNSLVGNGYWNVFHFTWNGDDGVNGYRQPALFVTKENFYLSIAAVNGATFDYELGQKYHIVFQQYQLEDKVMAEVKIDGEIIVSEENKLAKSFPGTRLYISDPWWPSFTSNYGSIENFEITKYSQF